MSDFSRIPVYNLEIDLPRCGNIYGSAPCTASGAAGSECYNTYKTCQDKTNFTLTTQTVAYCSAGAPLPAGQLVRPYIKPKAGVQLPPIEIDPRAGLAPRSTCTVALYDEPCPDHDMDPYHATRATPATGTYWGRLLARHHNLSNLTARIKRAYFTDGWDESEFITETYILETIRGPNGSDGVVVTLKDPIKLTDRMLLPPPSPGKLAVALGTNDLSLTLDSGSGASYGATGYVRVKGQIIRYTSNVGDVLSWPDSTYRSQFDTTAEAAEVGDVVQECIVYIDEPFSGVVEDINNRSGIADANIDLAGIQSEDDRWLGSAYLITTCLHEPTKASDYLQELSQETGGVIWWDPVAAKVKYKYIGPESPAALTGATLTDEANIIDGSVKVDPLDDLRLTRAYVGYSLANATANLNESKNFLGGRGYIDADAESPLEYNDVRSDVMYSRWFTTPNERGVTAFVKRRVGQYRDVPRNISLRVDAKDADIREADLYDVTTRSVVDETGAPRTIRCLVIKRKDNGNGLDLTLRTTNFSRRYGFIAPNGTSDYPDNADYACICLNTGKFSDGSSGYLII
ncbi:MAG: hypothetical protein ACOY9J_03465 [Pseudomonadota bacterium]